MTDQGLMDICKSPMPSHLKSTELSRGFCGDDAVPLTIGGVYFGFNQSTMDSICMGGDIVEANETFVDTCHSHARAMSDVQIKLAAFVSSLRRQEFRYDVMMYYVMFFIIIIIIIICFYI